MSRFRQNDSATAHIALRGVPGHALTGSFPIRYRHAIASSARCQKAIGKVAIRRANADAQGPAVGVDGEASSGRSEEDQREAPPRWTPVKTYRRELDAPWRDALEADDGSDAVSSRWSTPPEARLAALLSVRFGTPIRPA